MNRKKRGRWSTKNNWKKRKREQQKNTRNGLRGKENRNLSLREDKKKKEEEGMRKRGLGRRKRNRRDRS